ncbi:MAG: TonB-dependent receptor [Ignavibacteria bacterium]|nr:TonB-dependent receptor [Ignavibacteria bacterium]
MKIFIRLIVIFALSFHYVSFSQQGTSSSPIELPNFIIEGKEQLNVRAGMKQVPDKPISLTKEELDSINSLEKKPSFLLPLKTIPYKIYEKNFYSGFLKGEFGRYYSPRIEAGYEFEIENYKLFANGNFDASQGHIDNADYNRFDFTVSSQYIAPKKFYIFGGSKTVTSFNVKNDNLKLYAIKEPEKRNALLLCFDVISEGDFEGFAFETGAHIDFFTLKDRNKEKESAFELFLSASKEIGDFDIGALVKYEVDNLDAFSNSFAQFNGRISYINSFLTFITDAGVQGKSDFISNDLGLFLDANLNVNINKDFTLRNNLTSRYFKYGLLDYFYQNPYVTDSADVAIPDILSFKSSLLFHPSDRFSVSLSASISSSETQPVFVYDSIGSFNILYEKSKAWAITCDADISLTKKDLLSFAITFQKNELKSTSKWAPYVPAYKIAANYGRAWSEKFGTQFEIISFSERYVDLLNQHKLSSFLCLNAYADYKLSDSFTVYAKANNLLNSNVFLWERYKERDLFLAAGIFYKF